MNKWCNAFNISGTAQFCDRIQISSLKGPAGAKRVSQMAIYDYFGQDPDGARVYYNSTNKNGLTRNYNRKLWQVKYICTIYVWV